MRTQILIGLITAAIGLPSAALAQKENREERRDNRVDRKDDKRDKREQRRDKREEKRDDRKEKRDEKRDDRREKRQDKRDDRRDNRKDRRDDRADRKDDRRDNRADRREDRADNRKDRRDRRVDARDGRRDRRQYRDRFVKLRQGMVVSSFGPRMGPAGTTVVIRGQNFPPGATVTLAGQPLNASVTPRRITFKVPRKASDGAIVIKGGGGVVVVGMFDTKGRRDRKEWKKRNAERELRARGRLKARWASRAKDRAERQRAYDERQRELVETRGERARQRARAMRKRWERAFLASEGVQVELALHAARKARLLRMQRLADLDDREKLSLRIEVLIDREDARHERRMVVMKANFKG